MPGGDRWDYLINIKAGVDESSVNTALTRIQGLLSHAKVDIAVRVPKTGNVLTKKEVDVWINSIQNQLNKSTTPLIVSKKVKLKVDFDIDQKDVKKLIDSIGTAAGKLLESQKQVYAMRESAKATAIGLKEIIKDYVQTVGGGGKRGKGGLGGPEAVLAGYTREISTANTHLQKVSAEVAGIKAALDEIAALGKKSPDRAPERNAGTATKSEVESAAAALAEAARTRNKRKNAKVAKTQEVAKVAGEFQLLPEMLTDDLRKTLVGARVTIDESNKKKNGAIAIKGLKEASKSLNNLLGVQLDGTVEQYIKFVNLLLGQLGQMSGKLSKGQKEVRSTIRQNVMGSSNRVEVGGAIIPLDDEPRTLNPKSYDYGLLPGELNPQQRITAGTYQSVLKQMRSAGGNLHPLLGALRQVKFVNDLGGSTEPESRGGPSISMGLDYKDQNSARFAMLHELSHYLTNTAMTNNFPRVNPWNSPKTVDFKSRAAIQTIATSDLLADYVASFANKGQVDSKSYLAKLYGGDVRSAQSAVYSDRALLSSKGVSIGNFDMMDAQAVNKLFKAVIELLREGKSLAITKPMGSDFVKRLYNQYGGFLGPLGYTSKGVVSANQGRTIDTGIVIKSLTNAIKGIVSYPDVGGGWGKPSARRASIFPFSAEATPSSGMKPIGGFVRDSAGRWRSTTGGFAKYADVSAAYGAAGVAVPGGAGNGPAGPKGPDRTQGGMFSGFGRLGNTFERLGSYYIAGSIIWRMRTAAQSMAENIRMVSSEMTKLNIIMKLNKSEQAALQSELLRTSIAYGLEFQKVSELAQEYAKQGYTGEGLNTQVGQASKFINVTGMEPQAAVAALTAAKKQMNMTDEESLQLQDKWIKLARTQRVEAKDLADGFSKVAALAKNAGFTSDQLNAMLASTKAISNESGQNVGNAFRSIISRLNKPNNQISTAFSAVGINVEEYIGRTPELLELVASKWDKLTAAEKQSIAQAAAEKRRAAIFMDMMVAMRDANGYAKALNDSMSAQGSLDEANAEKMKSLEKQMQQFKQALVTLAAEFGNSGLGGMFSVWYKSISGLVTGFSKLPGFVKASVGLLVGLSTLMIGVFWVIENMGRGLKNVRDITAGWKSDLVQVLGLTTATAAAEESTAIAAGEAATAVHSQAYGTTIMPFAAGASSFIQDKTGRWHDPRGRWASNAAVAASMVTPELSPFQKGMERGRGAGDKAWAKLAGRGAADTAEATSALAKTKAVGKTLAGKVSTVFGTIAGFFTTTMGVIVAGIAAVAVAASVMYSMIKKDHERVLKARQEAKAGQAKVERYELLLFRKNAGTINEPEMKELRTLGLEFFNKFPASVKRFDEDANLFIMDVDRMSSALEKKATRPSIWEGFYSLNRVYNPWTQSYSMHPGDPRGMWSQRKDIAEYRKESRTPAGKARSARMAIQLSEGLIEQLNKQPTDVEGTVSKGIFRNVLTNMVYGNTKLAKSGAWLGGNKPGKMDSFFRKMLGGGTSSAEDIQNLLRSGLSDIDVAAFKKNPTEALRRFINDMNRLIDAANAADKKAATSNGLSQINQFLSNAKQMFDVNKAHLDELSVYGSSMEQMGGSWWLNNRTAGLRSKSMENMFNYQDVVREFQTKYVAANANKVSQEVMSEIANLLKKGDFAGAISKMKSNGLEISREAAAAFGNVFQAFSQMLASFLEQGQASAQAALYGAAGFGNMTMFQKFGTTFGAGPVKAVRSSALALTKQYADQFKQANAGGNVGKIAEAEGAYTYAFEQLVAADQAWMAMMDDQKNRAKQAKELAQQLKDIWLSAMREYFEFAKTIQEANTRQNYVALARLLKYAKKPQEKLQLRQALYESRQEVYSERIQGAQEWINHEVALERVSIPTQIKLWERALEMAKKIGKRGDIWSIEEKLYELKKKQAEDASKFAPNEMAKRLFQRAASKSGGLAIGINEFRAAMEQGSNQAKDAIDATQDMMGNFAAYMEETFGGMSSNITANVSKLWENANNYANSLVAEEKAKQAEAAANNGAAGAANQHSKAVKDLANQYGPLIEAADKVKKKQAEAFSLFGTSSDKLLTIAQSMSGILGLGDKRANGEDRYLNWTTGKMDTKSVVSAASNKGIVGLLQLIAKTLMDGKGNAVPGGSAAGGRFTSNIPVPGATLQSSWGNPRSGGRSHQGIDIFAKLGAPIYAAMGGKAKVGINALGGKSISIVSPDGTRTYYAHLSNYGIKNGATVAMGQFIGSVGNTGNAAGTAPHLHFQVSPGGGGWVDPFGWLKKLNGLGGLSVAHRTSGGRVVMHTGGFADADEFNTILQKGELVVPANQSPLLLSVLDRLNKMVFQTDNSNIMNLELNLTMPDGQVVKVKETVPVPTGNKLRIDRRL